MKRFVICMGLVACGRTLSVLCLSLLLLTTAGCKMATPIEVGNVKGKITYHGKPLPKGTIISFESGGYACDIELDEKGNYAGEAPLGKCKITFVPADETVIDPISSPIIPKSGDPSTKAGFPEKYADSETSGLETIIKKGDNVYDKDLTD